MRRLFLSPSPLGEGLGWGSRHERQSLRETAPPLPPPLKGRGLFFVLALFLPFPAFAQTSDEIVVTASGLEAPPGDAAYATTTLDRTRLTTTASGRLEDALRDVAGIAEFRRSDSRSAHPTSQGITLRGLGGNASSRALLTLDGVPQADPFGGWVAFPAWRAERLQGVRVVRGGGSGYAGPGALAGTIELTSAYPKGYRALDAGLAYGSGNSVDAYATGWAQMDPVGFLSASASYSRGDGFIPVVAEDRGPVDRAAPYEQASGQVRALFPVGTVGVYASVSAFRDRRDRGVDFTAIKSDGVDASLRVTGSGRWSWTALAYVQTRQFASGFASVNDARTNVTPTLDQYNVPSIGVGGRIEIAPPIGGGVTLRLGMDARAVSGRTHERFTYVSGLPTRRREAGGESATVGGFADASLESGPLTLSLGGRLDHWSIASGRLLETPLAGGAILTDSVFPDRTGWEATGRVGAAYRAGPATLRTAAYRGWRLPTLNELYRPFRVGADATAANAALDPERLTGAEAGIDLKPSPDITLSATAYWSRLDGAIANVTLANGPGNFAGVGFVSAAGVYRQRRNLDAVEAKGVEIDARYDAGEFSVSASWSLADSRVAASGIAASLDGLRPAQTPRNQGSATLGWHRRNWAASLTGRVTDAQFEDDQNLRRLAPAFTVDTLIRAPIGPRFRIEARGENLFDARVEAGVSGPGVIERATPRTLWIGLRYAVR